jgi:spore germination protein (amino acid permease)
MPVFGSGIVNIIKSTKETMLAYSGVEIIFLIYPFFKDNKKLKKCGIISVIITGTIYVWFTFVSIFYLGIEIIPTFIWPVVTVTEAVTIPVINSFRYVFMSLYTIIMLRVLSNCYYAFAVGISEITKKMNRKSVVVVMYPLICYLSLLYKNPAIRGDFLGKVVPIYAIFNVVYVAIIALLIIIKKDKK